MPWAPWAFQGDNAMPCWRQPAGGWLVGTSDVHLRGPGFQLMLIFTYLYCEFAVGDLYGDLPCQGLYCDRSTLWCSGVRPGFSEKISDSRKCRALNGKRNETCLQLADVSWKMSWESSRVIWESQKGRRKEAGPWGQGSRCEGAMPLHFYN